MEAKRYIFLSESSQLSDVVVTLILDLKEIPMFRLLESFFSLFFRNNAKA